MAKQKIDELLSYQKRHIVTGKCVVYIRNKKEAGKLQGFVDRAITGKAKILASYIEPNPMIDYLPGLEQAVDFANRRDAQLVIPNIQWIARSIAGINYLRELTNHEYIFTINEFNGKPFCRKEYIETFVGVFERTNVYRSENIKKSLQAKKKADPLWKAGNVTNINYARQLAEASRKQKADQYVIHIIPIIRRIQAMERTTLQQIADSLMDRNERTPRGKTTWTATTVRNVIERAKKLRR